MGRYETTLSVKHSTGKSIAGTTILKAPGIGTDDIYIKTTSAERLDLLAYDFYNDVSSWWIIAEANGITNGSLWVPIGTTLRIPIVTQLNDKIIKNNDER